MCFFKLCIALLRSNLSSGIWYYHEHIFGFCVCVCVTLIGADRRRQLRGQCARCIYWSVDEWAIRCKMLIAIWISSVDVSSRIDHTYKFIIQYTTYVHWNARSRTRSGRYSGHCQSVRTDYGTAILLCTINTNELAIISRFDFSSFVSIFVSKLILNASHTCFFFCLSLFCLFCWSAVLWCSIRDKQQVTK